MTTVSLCIMARFNAEQYRQLIASALNNVDEILVVVDLDPEPGIDGHLADRVNYLHRPTGHDRLAVDFSAQKNFLALNAKSEWMLYLDTDEQLDRWAFGMLKLIADSTIEEAIEFPMRHNVEGAGDYLSWPDYHVRMVRRRPHIIWKRPVHEYLDGIKSIRRLPPEMRYAITHTKTKEMQKRSNDFYASQIHSK